MDSCSSLATRLYRSDGGGIVNGRLFGVMKESLIALYYNIILSVLIFRKLRGRFDLGCFPGEPVLVHYNVNYVLITSCNRAQ